MPSVSGPQHRLMEMVAHGGKPSGVKGPPPSVAKEFVAADKAKGKKFSGPKEAAKVKALRKPPLERIPKEHDEAKEAMDAGGSVGGM